MLKLLTIPLISSLLCLSCATVSEPTSFTPKGSLHAHKISGKNAPLEGGSGIISVSIDDERVLQYALPLFIRHPFQAFGSWDKKPVRAVVTPITGGLTPTFTAEVFVDEEHAATLHL